MNALDIAARGLARRAFDTVETLSSAEGAANVGMADGGSVQMALSATRSEMEASEAATGQRAYLTEGEASGLFEADDSIDPAQAAADGGGRFISSAGAPWVRRYAPGTPVSPLWWPNASPDGETDNAVPLLQAINAAAQTGEAVTLSTPYRAAVWGTTQPLDPDMSTTLRGTGGRTTLKALPGFPETLEVTAPTGTISAPGPTTTKTVPAPLLMFNSLDSNAPGTMMNMTSHIQLHGNNIAPVGLMVLGGGNFAPSGIRVTGTTFAGGIVCGLQNAVMTKLQFYETGDYGLILMNGTFNSTFIGVDLRRQVKSDLWMTDDAAYPYFGYVTGVSGAQECVFIKGVWEDSRYATKEHVLRLEKGRSNQFIGMQWHGSCSTSMLYEGPDVVRNLYTPSLWSGTANAANGKAAELRGYRSTVRDVSLALFGSGSPSIVDLIEVHGFSRFENVSDGGNNVYSGKFIANKSASPDDARRIGYVPYIQAGQTSQRDIETLAHKVDAIVHYYDTTTRRLASRDYRSTVVNKWGDQPTYTPGDVTPNVQCPHDAVMEVANSDPVTLLNLLNTRQGQKITLVWKDGNTTIHHGGAFMTKSGSSIISAAGKSNTFVKEPTSPFKLIEI